jgi:hypothetical protein
MPLSIAGERHELIAVLLQPGGRIGNVDVAALDHRNNFIEPVFLRFLRAVWRYILHAVVGDQGSVHRVARAISLGGRSARTPGEASDTKSYAPTKK